VADQHTYRLPLQRFWTLEIEAQQLLLVGYHSDLARRRATRFRQNRVARDPVAPKQLLQFAAAFVRSDGAKGDYLRSQRGEVSTHVASAPGKLFRVRHTIHQYDGYRRFGRDPRCLAPQELIQHEIAQYPDGAQAESADNARQSLSRMGHDCFLRP